MTIPSHALVRRGGSWYSNTAICRPTYRHSYGDAEKIGCIGRQLGFRVVCLPRGVAPSWMPLRGGSWFCVPHSCRATGRGHFKPAAHSALASFRVVCLPREVAPRRAVLRGGAWDSLLADSRSAQRSMDLPVHVDDYIGFRVIHLPPA